MVSDRITVAITDEGRVFYEHRLGIALSREHSFEQLEYQDKGNKEVCTVFLNS